MSLAPMVPVTTPDAGGLRLCRAFLAAALLSLAVGGLAAAGIAMARAPILPFPDDPGLYYRLLTLHGLTTFYHWLLFFQVALIILAIGLYVPGARPWSTRLGWLSFGLMAAGAIGQAGASLEGAPVLYTAFAPVAGQFPRSPLIYLGFLLLSLGLLGIAANFILTVAQVRRQGLVRELPTPTYVGLVWTIIIAAASLIAVGIYTPALLWSLGLIQLDPMAYMMGYFTFFHVNHYVPLVAAVGVWYALAKHTTGARSIFGDHFSKAVFTIYPIIVPPTFLYHLFLAPGVPANVKTTGSILSAFIGVPTIIVAVVVTGMLEARMRAVGARGSFGWLRALPWGSPAFAGLAMGMATFGLGGIFAYALLSEGLATLLHGTFVVPGYFHAFTSGGVTLTFMGATYALLPVLSGRELWGRRSARTQPYLMALGALIFVVFGTLAGYLGAPRRVPDSAYGGSALPAWTPLMNIAEGIGGLLMVVAGLLFFAVVIGTVLAGSRTEHSTIVTAHGPEAPMPVPTGMTWASAAPAVLVVTLITLVSIASFELVRRAPFLAP